MSNSYPQFSYLLGPNGGSIGYNGSGKTLTSSLRILTNDNVNVNSNSIVNNTSIKIGNTIKPIVNIDNDKNTVLVDSNVPKTDIVTNNDSNSVYVSTSPSVDRYFYVYACIYVCVYM